MSTAHSPAAMPRIAHWPFLLVFIVVPPRPGSSSLTLAPSIGLPSGSSTLPSSRPWPPRQSWAPAGTASARIAAARDSLDSDITYLLDGRASGALSRVLETSDEQFAAGARHRRS